MDKSTVVRGMNRKKESRILLVIMFLDFVLMIGTFLFFWLKFLDGHAWDSVTDRLYSIIIVIIFSFLFNRFTKTYETEMISYHMFGETFYSQTLVLISTDFLMFFVIWLVNQKAPLFSLILLMFIIQIGLTWLWSMASHKWYDLSVPKKKSLMVKGRDRDLTAMMQAEGLDHNYIVEKSMNIEELSKDMSILDTMDQVFLVDVHSHDCNEVIKYCVDKNIGVFVLPSIGDVLKSGAQNVHLLHLPFLSVNRYQPEFGYAFWKRFFDIFLSALALVILSPLLLITALIIKCTDHGPAFYKQTRLTKDGKTFELIKFRSMRVDAEKDGVARLSTGDKDPRITPIGRKIRATRIDELPQLINILKGDMSIVGPRPERPEIAKQYEEELPEFKLRLQAKAGLTGFAQVYGKYNTTPYDKLELDLMYIAHPSLARDLELCFATVKILFMKESTEGITEGQTTAAVQNKNVSGI